MRVQDDPSSSIQLIATKLLERGYSLEKILLRGKTYYSFTSPNGRSWITLGYRISYPFQTKAIAEISGNKALAGELAEHVGVPTPETITIAKGSDILPAVNLMDRHESVIVKPLDASLARGLTLDIHDENHLKSALNFAYGYSETAVVQQQVKGQEIRFAVIGSKVRAALLKRTPHIIGDGKHSIAELIHIENERRANLNVPYLTYLQLDETLIPKRYLTDETVLEPGKELELSLGTMVRTGATFHNIIDEMDHSYISEIEKLASKLGHGFVVVDMFMSDYTVPKSYNNHWFIEFNTAPYLKLFYACVEGKPFDIVSELVPLIDETVSGVDQRD